MVLIKSQIPLFRSSPGSHITDFHQRLIFIQQFRGCGTNTLQSCFYLRKNRAVPENVRQLSFQTSKAIASSSRFTKLSHL